MNKNIPLIITLLVIQVNMIAQESKKKILLTPNDTEEIQYGALNINTLLQIYDKNAASNLVGDIYLRVKEHSKIIADFYINNNKFEKACQTKIYKNYFLTLSIENNKKYLILEQAQFGKTFILTSTEKGIIGDTDDVVEIEITDFYQESGYDAPSEFKNRKHFVDVHYTIKVKSGELVEDFSFYSSDLKENYAIEFGDYTIKLISDKMAFSSASISMIMSKYD